MNILVINLGLKSVRAIVFNETGVKLASCSEPVTTAVYEDVVEQNPNEWWRKTQRVARAAVQSVQSREQITLLAVTASASCLVCVDSNGEPLMNSIMVSDARAKGCAELLEATDEFREVKAATGMKASPDLMLPKIMWLKQNRSEVYDRTHRFLSPGGFLIGRITGKFVMDTNNASKFHFDVSSKRWPTGLLAVLGINENKLPAVAEPGTPVGNIKKSVAEEWGLPGNATVFLATYDALCAVPGAGVFEPGEACDISGTVTSLRVVTEKRLRDPEKGIFFSPCFRSPYWMAGGSSNLGGGLIEWAKQFIFRDHEDLYSAMESDSSNVAPCAEGLIFLPYLLGERAPVWDPLARGVFFRLSRQHTQKHMLRDGSGNMPKKRA